MRPQEQVPSPDEAEDSDSCTGWGVRSGELNSARQPGTGPSVGEPAVDDVSCNFDKDFGWKKPGNRFFCHWWPEVPTSQREWKTLNGDPNHYMARGGMAPRNAAEGRAFIHIYSPGSSGCGGSHVCFGLLHASPLNLSEPKQLQFKYNIVGDGQKVKLVVLVDGETKFEAFGQHRWEGPEFTIRPWRDGAVPLSPNKGGFMNITFVGVTDNRPLGGYVAIDAMKLLPATAPTPLPPKPAPTPPSKPTCWCTGKLNEFWCNEWPLYKAYCAEWQDCTADGPFQKGNWSAGCKHRR